MHDVRHEPMRIGELSRRTGVAPDLLRAWERRYGLLSPERTAGGFRLYGSADVERVLAMTAAIAEGLPASVAARRAASTATKTPSRPSVPAAAPPLLVDEFEAALDAFDETRANAVFDGALAGYSLASVLGSLVMPYLQRLGRRWQDGEATIAQEHFATGIVRGRLLGLARGWGTGVGRMAVLACPPGEQHDLGLIVFGLVLREQGWRIVLLGPNTPVATLAEAADRLRPELVIVAAMQTELLDGVQGELGELAARHRVALAGPGATARLARRTDAWLVSESPVEGAIGIARDAAGPPIR
jgi:DNA-binding transcriptional MerR regulator